jgi:hypothetical protein
MLETGLHRISREDYDSIDAVSWSIAKPLRRSPAHCLAALKGKTSEALSLGIAGHMAVLEPEKFATAHIWTGAVRRGKEWEAFKASAGNEPIFTAEEAMTAKSIARAIQSNPIAQRYLQGGESELSVLCELEKVQVKARIDYVSSAIVEFKTTTDASPRMFGVQVAKLDYLGQCALYRDAHHAVTQKLLPVVFIAAEKEAPWAVQTYRVPEELLLMGRAVYRPLLWKWAECRERNAWPAYADGELELRLPAWAYRESFEDAA